ncbi:hypothetical protein [Lapidilactobacillus wuchangensis]|uniref:hypothetical protein n=1 Tax=Lapidilactobacillus wuchangensis TaxID=2486001 RepID=UPI000F774AF9|nr:hypothetical protein [Lapidilactobacillus wuchangensis]
MATLKQIKQQVKHTLNFFFDLDDDTTIDAPVTPAAMQVPIMNPQLLQEQMTALVTKPQTVALQIKTDQPNQRQTQFLVGQFRTVNWQNNTAVFRISHSNLIQLVRFDQIIRIAA